MYKLNTFNKIALGMATILMFAPVVSAVVTDFVKEAEDSTSEDLEDAEIYYENGECSLIVIIINSLDKKIDATKDSLDGFQELMAEYESNGDIDSDGYYYTVGLYSEIAASYTIYVDAYSAIIHSYYGPCEEGVSVGVAQEVETVPQVNLSDISGNKNQEAIEYLYDAGVISGYPDGTFQPDNTVNRAELLKILVGGKGVTPSLEEYSDCFPDVTTDWYAPYVCYAKSEGWVDGYPDGTFKPESEVNKVEAIKMLVNSQGYSISEEVSEPPFDDVSTSEWFAPYVEVAKDKGLLEEDGASFGVEAQMTRGGVSENIYRAMIVSENDLNDFSEYGQEEE